MNRPSILLVEDEFLISVMISEALIDDGFDVHAFSNADDALRYLASGFETDLLFTDINLPGELDGSALAMRARELRPSLPVVYASARGLERLRMVPGGMFLPKPYTPAQVRLMLTKLVAAPH